MTSRLPSAPNLRRRLLLWPHDRERARAIFRQAFQSLARETLTAGERRQLREELLNRIASRDAELAEELARAAAYPTESLKRDGALRRREARAVD